MKEFPQPKFPRGTMDQKRTEFGLFSVLPSVLETTARGSVVGEACVQRGLFGLVASNILMSSSE